MASRFSSTIVRVMLASAMLLALVAAPALASEPTPQRHVLRIGWASDPQTLNPFVGLEGENYAVWAINWDLLVNFSPKDLSPAPGIAQSWRISPDRRTVTFTLKSGRKWSDGVPITSADVKYTLETLGKKGALFSGYASTISSVTTPDADTVVVTTSRPDTRIVGGLLIHILPQHIWSKVPIKELTSSYQPALPLVGSGPFIVTEFSRHRLLRLERNPNFDGPRPAFDEVQFIKYGNQDAVERALKLGEVDLVGEVSSSTFKQLGEAANVKTVRSSSPSFTELAFNTCPPSRCPDAERNPAVQDRAVRQAIAYAVDRQRLVDIASRGTALVGHGQIPSYYASFYDKPAQDYAPDVAKANQLLDEAGYRRGADGVRTKNGHPLVFDLFVRAEEQFDNQAARLITEMTAPIGVKFVVRVVSVDKLTDITTRFVDDKPAPAFDAFIWNWDGDPYDPGLLLSIMTTSEIGASSDSFFSNAQFDRLYDEQSGTFDVQQRKQIIAKMVAILQRELPYVVLTEDPNLQAYRTDRLANVVLSCPAKTGDIFCEQIASAPLVTLKPAQSVAQGGSGARWPLRMGLAALVLLGIGVAWGRRRRSERPGELELAE